MSVEVAQKWLIAEGAQAPLLIRTQTQATLISLLTERDLQGIEVLSLPTEGKLTIKQMRGVLTSLGLATTYHRRLIFIPDIERLQVAAANTLLKTLEEASEENRFLFTSAYPGRLLATIRSRCQIVRLRGQQIGQLSTPIGQATRIPGFVAKRKTPLTTDEAAEVATSLQMHLCQIGPNAAIHRSMSRLRDFYKARASGAGEKLASDALLASLVDVSLE